jgi:hypothetical protein
VKTLGISVLGNLSGGAQAGLVEKLAELSNLFLRSGDKTVLLFAFDTGLGGDRKPLFRSVGKLKSRNGSKLSPTTGIPAPSLRI